MPQYKGDLKFPKPTGPHILGEVVGAYGASKWVCVICDIDVDPKDAEAHRALFEPEAASK